MVKSNVEIVVSRGNEIIANAIAAVTGKSLEQVIAEALSSSSFDKPSGN